MKRIISIWGWGMWIILSGCADWIDVSPKTDVKADELFTSEDGFKSALTGIYGRMTKGENYGGNLTFTFLEQLVQRYDNYRTGTVTEESRADIYDYKNQESSKSSIKTIWSNMYTNIANINNLLKNLETNGEAIITEGYRDLIKGEALGLRAFHYFDLLRLWGPVYSLDSTAKIIPWRDQFSFEKVPLIAANELAGKILNDLQQAEGLLEEDKMDYAYNPFETFVGERKHRMNKYAVKALMARVYLYIGNKTKAAEYARDVIDHCGLKLVRNNQKDVSMYGETLFCLGMFNMEEKLSEYWKNTLLMNTELWISAENAEAVFEKTTCGINDIRYKKNYGFIHGNNQLMCRKYLGEEVLMKEKIPLIRLSEMYYILAESVSLDESITYINLVRNTRGISRIYDIQSSSNYTEEVRIETLLKEYQKDFFAEGQFFYFLKRHDRKTFHRCPVEEMTYYVFPLPDDEVEYGWTTD